jgi:hypothetical protein
MITSNTADPAAHFARLHAHWNSWPTTQDASAPTQDATWFTCLASPTRDVTDASADVGHDFFGLAQAAGPGVVVRLETGAMDSHFGPEFEWRNWRLFLM